MDISALTAAATQSSPTASSMPAVGGVGGDSFRDIMSGELARQKAAGTVANGRVPSAQEAQITAAQIAAQANVLGPLKRDPIVPGAGMNSQPTTPTVQPVPGKFFPLNRQLVVPQGQTTPSRAVAPTTVEALRATNKFAPGPVTTNMSAAQRYSVPQTTTSQASNTTPQASAATPAQGIPPWFNQAMKNLDKYDAMKAGQ